MDDQQQEKARQAIAGEIELYSKLENLKRTPDFDEYLQFIVNSAAAKALSIYYGDKAPSYDDFLANWGEIRGKLFVLQEVGGADRVKQSLVKQLQTYMDPEA